MYMHLKFMIGILSFIFCLACSNTPPSSHYILTSSKVKALQGTTQNQMRLGVGPIKLPGRLDRYQIVTRVGTNVINIHEFDRWGDSLQRQFEERLADNLSQLLQTNHVVIYPWERALRPHYQILVQVKKFEGPIEFGTRAIVVWQIIDVTNETLKKSGQFVAKVKSKQADMEGYVKSQSKALIALSKEIARAVQELETK